MRFFAKSWRKRTSFGPGLRHYGDISQEGRRMAAIKVYKMLIDGAWVAAGDGGLFDSVNPADGKVWAQVPEATAEDVDRAVRAAHRAFSSGPWATMTPRPGASACDGWAICWPSGPRIWAGSRRWTPARC